jgi:hexosaminidase
VKNLWHIHRKMWYNQHKPQGWEVIEGRYGRLMNRIDTARWRLQAYLSGEIESLPELEEIREKMYDHGPELLPDVTYGRTYTASNIK